MRLSADALFGADRPSDIVGRSVRGGGVALASQAVRFSLQAASTIVLARLLSPSDFGVVAMATVVVGLAQVFQSAGLSYATVQQDEITREQIDSLFWINLVMSAVVASCVALASPLVAFFYNSPALMWVTLALAPSFVIVGVAVQHDALLRRHMKFSELASIQVAAQIVYVTVAMIFAKFGLRYWALVGGTLAMTLTTSLLTVYLCPFVPRRARRGAGVKRMILFGGRLTAFDFINYFSRNSDNLLIGRFLGSTPLGLYSRVYSLFMLPISQIRNPLGQVGLPALSALQGEAARFRHYFSTLVSLLAALTVPLGVYCMLQADFVIRLFLGPQWSGAVGAFRILSIVGIIQPTSTSVGLILVSLGQAERQLKLGFVSTVATVTAFAVGLHWGLAGVAGGYAVATYVLVIPTVWYSCRQSPARPSDFWVVIWPSLLASAVAGMAAMLVSISLPFGWVADGVAALVVFLAVYVALTLIRPSIRQILRGLWSSRGDPRGRRSNRLLV